jgi:hypothetical protein
VILRIRIQKGSGGGMQEGWDLEMSEGISS